MCQLQKGYDATTGLWAILYSINAIAQMWHRTLHVLDDAAHIS
jgi:hypothetical protein